MLFDGISHMLNFGLRMVSICIIESESKCQDIALLIHFSAFPEMKEPKTQSILYLNRIYLGANSFCCQPLCKHQNKISAAWCRYMVSRSMAQSVSSLYSSTITLVLKCFKQQQTKMFQTMVCCGYSANESESLCIPHFPVH